MYAVSACLVLVLIIMGVSMINSFDRMKSVQNTLDTLAGSSDKVETQETSGTVTAVTEEQGGEEQAGDGQASGADSALDADNRVDADSGKEDLSGGDNAGISANASGNDSGTSSTGGKSEDAGTAGGGTDGSSQILAAPGENGSDGVYIVEEGDTLAIISRKMYGDVTHVDAICKMNGITDGNLIYVGQKLLLP